MANGASRPGPAAVVPAISVASGAARRAAPCSSSTSLVLPMPPSPSSSTAPPAPFRAACQACDQLGEVLVPSDEACGRLDHVLSRRRAPANVPAGVVRPGGRALKLADQRRRPGRNADPELAVQPIPQLGQRRQRGRRIARLDQRPDQVSSGRLVQRAQRRPAPSPARRGRRVACRRGLLHEVPERGGDITVEFLASFDHPVIVEFLQQVPAAQVERGRGLTLRRSDAGLPADPPRGHRRRGSRCRGRWPGMSRNRVRGPSAEPR